MKNTVKKAPKANRSRQFQDIRDQLYPLKNQKKLIPLTVQQPHF